MNANAEISNKILANRMFNVQNIFKIKKSYQVKFTSKMQGVLISVTIYYSLLYSCPSIIKLMISAANSVKWLV